VNLEAKKKEKEQLNKEIQELMDRVKELDKEIQSLETKSKLKKDVAGATLI
jgi:predicted  nucleic acid-binding Zn-ribbon protein